MTTGHKVKLEPEGRIVKPLMDLTYFLTNEGFFCKFGGRKEYQEINVRPAMFECAANHTRTRAQFEKAVPGKGLSFCKVTQMLKCTHFPSK